MRGTSDCHLGGPGPGYGNVAIFLRSTPSDVDEGSTV